MSTCASGLVVKSIVAIDGPPVQFRAGAFPFHFDKIQHFSFHVFHGHYVDKIFKSPDQSKKE